MTVVTRFAPSPTGMLHLGSVRTALFNWLFARHYGGIFRLRIEDTDQKRSQEIFVEEFLETLRWLGLHWDGEIVFQSNRTARYQEVARELLKKGHAYACYSTPEELENMKEEAISQGKPPLYNRKWRDHTLQVPDYAPAIRLKVPLSGKCVLEDGVQGNVEVLHETLDDMVLLRSDGTPTYMLAVVVDDHDMDVTHILRGDDHLTNTFRQIQIYHAMGWSVPKTLHIPLIHSEDGQKLSKRNGAMSALTYRTGGILPEALLNAMMRLGWSHGNEEKITIEQGKEWFDGKDLLKSPARFDDKKILALNGYYLRKASAQQIWDALQFFDGDLGDKARALMILPALAQRSKTLLEVKESLLCYTFSDLPIVPVLDTYSKEILRKFLSRVDSSSSEGKLEVELRHWAEAEGEKFSSLAKALRLALTGSTISPGLTEIFAVLGHEWVQERIARALRE